MNVQAEEAASNDPLLLNEELSTDFSLMLSELGPRVTDDDDDARGKRRLFSTQHAEPPSSSKRTKLAYRRVRCKARGMSESHNSDTAYFEIPANAPHGLLLCCTHPECQASNRKFRFCKGKFFE